VYRGLAQNDGAECCRCDRLSANYYTKNALAALANRVSVKVEPPPARTQGDSGLETASA